ncbi:MAG: DNA translocase FtsK, partial [Clostridiales bacterium]|nr:DNA translocase FtsK [Clostridiales bacterium]
ALPEEVIRPVSSALLSRSIAPVSATAHAKMDAPTEDAGQAEQSEQGAEGVYQMPPIDLLNPVAAQKGGRDETQSKAEVLEKTLKSFRIDAKVIGTSKGPTVTRYELQPAAGVKVSKIVNLSNDIALNMAASSIRIEAPIPGKAAIGIEVPNDKKAMVTIREMLDTDEFRNHKSKLAFAVGKDISGKNVYGDLAKMPHLLIAGTTGAGKSVCVNGIIMSYLYHTPPSELEIVMVDPKVVEMEMYNGIPYLMGPVITDPKKAAQALNQSVTEMLNRYKLFARAGVKDIDRYNLYCKENGLKLMKKRVIIVDELADLMMASAHEVEDSICRIAQLGRASGIHLIIATQSPRVDVITGLIKANIPSRIALTVSSAIDSRTILDAGGAEKLLYNGDMLYMPVGASKPIRLQGCYVTDQENERVLDYIKGLGVESNYDEEFIKGVESAAEAKEEGAEGGSFEDELIPKAIQLALEYEQISISMLQRRLKVGYARAARLVDEMEANGFVSAADGSKPRQVLITWEEYHRMFGEGEVF